MSSHAAEWTSTIYKESRCSNDLPRLHFGLDQIHRRHNAFFPSALGHRIHRNLLRERSGKLQGLKPVHQLHNRHGIFPPG